LTQAVI
jgi:hypothetical protein